jgi:hypothetical protein
MLLVGLEPTDLVFLGVSVPVLVAAMPDAVRGQFTTIYKRSKSHVDNGTLKVTSRSSKPTYPTLYVSQKDYLGWAKAQGFDIPIELQQSKQPRYWMRQDTRAKVTRAEVMTTAKIKTEYVYRIPDGERRLGRMFDPKGSDRTNADIDPVPLRVVWSDSGKAVKGKYVTALVRDCLEPECTKPRNSVFAPGESGRAQKWGPVRPSGNRGGSSGDNDDD